jgi:dUTP pyrophosphatase
MKPDHAADSTPGARLVIPCVAAAGLLPEYASSGAAGADLRACLAKPILIAPGEFKLVPTGVTLAIPAGFEGQVRPRSGLALRHGVTVLNAPGTVDADYRGEIKVILINHGQGDFMVSHGDRIAQLVISPCLQARFTGTERVEDTARGPGGFGSTGST